MLMLCSGIGTCSGEHPGSSSKHGAATTRARAAFCSAACSAAKARDQAVPVLQPTACKGLFESKQDQESLSLGT